MKLIVDNLRGVVVVIGFVALYCGVAGLSIHVANIVAGSLLMLFGVVPYLRKGNV